MDALLELSHVFADVGAADASMTFNVHVIAEGDDDLLNLLCKLAGRGQDKGLCTLDVHIKLMVKQILSMGPVTGVSKHLLAGG